MSVEVLIEVIIEDLLFCVKNKVLPRYIISSICFEVGLVVAGTSSTVVAAVVVVVCARRGESESQWCQSIARVEERRGEQLTSANRRQESSPLEIDALERLPLPLRGRRDEGVVRSHEPLPLVVQAAGGFVLHDHDAVLLLSTITVLDRI